MINMVSATWWICTFLMISISLATVVFNTAVLVALNRLQKTSEYRSLRSLAVADLVQGAVVQTLWIARHLCELNSFPEFLTVLQNIADSSSTTASILSMTLLCWVRWTGVTAPLSCHDKRAMIYLRAVWSAAFAMAIATAVEAITVYSSAVFFVFFYPLIFVLLPALAIIFWCTNILTTMSKPLEAPMRAHRGRSTLAGNTCNGSRQCMQRKIKRAAYIMTAVICCYIITCFPYYCILPMGALCECVSPVLQQIFTWLRYFNSALNPLLYAAASPTVRMALQDVILRRRRILVHNCSICVNCLTQTEQSHV